MRRLAVADEQTLDAEENYDYLVVNDELETAIYRVVSILQSPATSDEDSDAFRAAGDAAITRSDSE